MDMDFLKNISDSMSKNLTNSKIKFLLPMLKGPWHDFESTFRNFIV